ncbi:MAG: SDR family oxidoreductase [Acidobacteria bacterium]|nr:SDR family oxidoreductase [Acidobacteriota bacterium]
MSAHSQHAFSEKVALITDGANPIGKAVALQLALYGAFVITGYDPSANAESAALGELMSLGTLASTVEADISGPEGVEKLISTVKDQFGRLDLLINCQDFRPDSAFSKTTEKEFDETIARNFRSLFFVTQHALQLMEDRPKPKIVNIVSDCNSEKLKADLGYLSANAAIIAFTKGLAASLPANYRANVVKVREGGKAVSKFDIPDDELFRKPSGVDADDVARVVLFLLSGEAAGINGQVFMVE